MTFTTKYDVSGKFFGNINETQLFLFLLPTLRAADNSKAGHGFDMPGLSRAPTLADLAYACHVVGVVH